MKQHWFIIFLLSLCTVSGITQTVPGERIPLPGEDKKLLASLKTASTLPAKTEALLALSAYYTYFPGEDSTDHSRAETYRLQASRLADSLKLPDAINQCLLLKGTLMYEEQKKDSGAQVYQRLAPLLAERRRYYQSTKNIAGEARTIHQLAAMYSSAGENDRSIATYTELVKFYSDHKLPNKHYPLFSLSGFYAGGDKSRWLYYLHEAEASMEATKDYASAAVIFNDLGDAYRKMNQLEKAIGYFLRSYDFFRIQPSFQMYVCLYGISEAYTKMHKPELGIRFLKKSASEIPPDMDFNRGMINFSLASCYMAAKQYEEAEKELKLKAYHWRNLPGIEINVTKDLAQLYVESGQSAKARPMIDKCISSGEYDGPVLAHLHYLGYQADSAAGDYKSAMQHLLLNKQLDAAENEKLHMSQSQELQVRYETEKKDRELEEKQRNIQSLEEKDRLRQTSLKQATMIRNMTIIGSILLLIVLVLLFNQYRLKTRTSRELSISNMSLEQLVTEKEWLLKEVHHRVKNNLQTIVSLLETQSGYLRDDALAAIQNSQHRVHAMALIHQRLYQKENSTIVEMGEYLPEVARYLEDSFDTRQRVHFLLDIEEISLDISQAIPLGLILNEAVTNSIKYAFPHGRQGEIRIRFIRLPDERLSLSISDNGTGMPDEPGRGQEQSFGLRLMKGLSDDLGADYSIRSLEGTTVTIIFTRDPGTDPPPLPAYSG